MKNHDQPPPSTEAYRVFVIFHGLWVFEARKTGIRAHTPFEPDHVVCAGFFEPVGGVFADRTVRLCSGEFSLEGVYPGNDLHFSRQQNVVIPHKPFLPKFNNKRFAVVNLPTPHKIWSLRNVRVPASPQHPFGGVDGEHLHPHYTSMVQAFGYRASDGSKVALAPSHATPYINEDSRVVKLHLYAEPPTTPDQFHARDSYTTMAEMFNLNIIPVAPMFTPATKPPVEDLDQNDMLMLMEILMPMPSIGVGSKGSNCDALVIDNTELDHQG